MLHLWSFIRARGWPNSLYCHSGSFFFSLLLAPDAMQSWALYNTHSSSQFAVATAKQEMSSISQTKVPLVNIFFGNMIRLNTFPSWLSQNWLFFESPKWPDNMSGHPRICSDNVRFWPDIVRWPAVISSPDRRKVTGVALYILIYLIFI